MSTRIFPSSENSIFSLILKYTNPNSIAMSKIVANLVNEQIGVLPEIVDLTQVIGSHTGPGLIALFFIGKDGK